MCGRKSERGGERREKCERRGRKEKGERKKKREKKVKEKVRERKKEREKSHILINVSFFFINNITTQPTVGNEE